ncbi:MAG: hypothetical protein JST00_25155 [Deltaproteobacteria bacterium]|nr:hypothetical protein [Deltaproteobacteria bacterium]
MSSLASCSGCRRHIRRTERACPFCGAEPGPSAASDDPAGGASAWPRSRAAILFAGVTAIAGCGKKTEGLVTPAYGVPPPDSMLTVEAGVNPDAGTMPVAPYGVPLPPPELEPKPSATPSASASAPPKAPPPKKK